MLFSSPIFLFLFLPIVLLFYFTIGRKYPNLILGIASIVFYFWGEPEFIYILLIVIVINYYLGLQIQKYLFQAISAKLNLFLAIIINLGFLVYYKYWFFLLHNIFLLLGKDQFNVTLGTIPLAISFFTFHAISYNVDIFRKKAKAQKNPLQLLLYFLFFPHLLAGPIVRYHSIVEQLKKRTIYLNDFTVGVERFILGLAKKVLIADKLSPVVNEIFAIPIDHIGTPVAWVGIICFTLQIYFDFSGYSDMAIGLARMFGFTFPENFNYPYISTSITEFWRRWHMTLSNWFRDYVYIPLGGNRVHALKRYFNLWTVFILVGWVFFRAENLPDAAAYLLVLFGFKNQGIIFHPVRYFLQLDIITAILVGIICSVPSAYYLKKIGRNFEVGFKLCKLVGLVVVLLLISAAVSSQTYNPFLYFRF